MTIIDSHCHPQFSQYDADRKEIITRAESAGIGMICVGTDLETSKQAIELANKNNGVWATVGIHPNAVDEYFNTNTLVMFESLCKDPKVVAIGEVGLDYYRTPESEKQEMQKKVLTMFLDLAVRQNKPVIIHSRDAGKGSLGRVHSDMISVLESVNCKLETKNPPLRGVAHSFTGTIAEAQKYLDLGFYLGFNGIITFTDQYNEMIKTVPLDRILLETDAPYLAPKTKRGQRNESVYITEVGDKIAKIKNIEIAKVFEMTTENTKILFRI